MSNETNGTAKQPRRRMKSHVAGDRPQQELFSLGSEFEWLENMEETEMQWIIPKMIPANSTILLEGTKGTGKSCVLACIAAHMTGGPPLPMAPITRSSGTVLWIANEEDYASVVKPRLRQSGAVVSRVISGREDPTSGARRRLKLPADLSKLTWLAEAHCLKAIVVDPWLSLLPYGARATEEQAVRDCLEPLGEWCNKFRVSVFLTRHLGKAKHSLRENQGLGSVAIGNVARAILRCEHRPSEETSKLLSVIRCNAAPNGPSLSYTITGKGNAYWAEFAGVVDMDHEREALSDRERGELDERTDAENLLLELLTNGPLAANEVIKEARLAGVCERTLRDAKVKLGIESLPSRETGKPVWMWHPPAQAARPSPER
jgi:hypothetical protein